MSAQPDLRSTSMSRRQRRDRTARALSAVAQTSSERRRQELLDYVVRINMGVARTVAGRYFHRGIDEDDLIQVAYMALTRAARDFDASRHQDFLSYALVDFLGEADQATPAAEARVVLAPVVKKLKPRDRRIVYLRFFEQKSQQEIADEIGVTQMQVSRLLARILRDLYRDLNSTGEGSVAHASAS